MIKSNMHIRAIKTFASETVRAAGLHTYGFTDVTDYELMEGKSQLKSCLLSEVIILIFFFKVVITS